MKFHKFIAIFFAFFFSSNLLGAQQVNGPGDDKDFREQKADSSNFHCDKSALNLSNHFDLNNLVLAALCNNSDLKQVRRNIESARLEFEEADAKYASDYQFRLNNNAQFGDTSALQSAVNTSGLAEVRSDADRLFLTLRWTLPWWYKSEFKYEAAKNRLGIDIAELQYRKKIQDTVLEIYKAYIGLLLQHQKMLIANRRLEIAREEKRAAERNLELGRISDLDTLSEESNLIDQQIATDDIVDAFESKKVELSGLVGLPALPWDNLGQQNPIAYSKFSAENFKLNDAILFQTREIQLQIAQQALEVDKQKDIWKPQISTWVGYSPIVESVGTLGDRGDITNLVTLGLEIRVDLPNFSASSAAAKAATHDRQDLDDQLNFIVQTTHDQSDQLVHKIDKLNGQLELLQKLRQVRQQQFRAAQKSFELGKITELAFKPHDTSYREVEVKYYEKLADYLVAQAELKRLYGIPIAAEIQTPLPIENNIN
jgi:outer membrane protein TolC